MGDEGVCGRCGAPLPRGEQATCSYCGVTTGGTSTLSPAALAERRIRVLAAFQGSIRNGADPELAISIAAREHLGPMGETDALARIVTALARRFEQQSGASVVRDAMVMSRLLEGYLGAIEEMRQRGYSELKLPFLTATAAGPHHLEMRLDPGTVRALLQPARQEKPKSGWWPFSR